MTALDALAVGDFAEARELDFRRGHRRTYLIRFPTTGCFGSWNTVSAISRLLRLISKWLKAGVMEEGRGHGGGDGSPARGGRFT